MNIGAQKTQKLEKINFLTMKQIFLTISFLVKLSHKQLQITGF